MDNRKVRVYGHKRKKNQLLYEKVFIGEAVFHQFGCGYQEFETGPGNFSTAIVEMENGEVKNIPVEMIEFVDRIEKATITSEEIMEVL